MVIKISKQKRIDYENTMKQFRVLIQDGRLFTKGKIQTVCLLSDKEQADYIDCIKGYVVISSVFVTPIEINITDSKTALAVISEDKVNYYFGHGNDRIWKISEEQENRIIDECQKAEYLQKKRDSENKALIEAKEKAIFQEAKETGKKQVIKTWISPECTENLPDCSFDAATLWALPNGKTEITYSHCH